VKPAVTAAALLLSGCATIAAGAQIKRDTVMAEMKLVLPHVNAAHLKKCRELLQQPLWHGSQYAIAPNAQLVPSLQHSCAHQEDLRNRFFPAYLKVVALAVEMKHVAGMPVLPSAQGCAFTLNENDKQIEISRAMTQAPQGSICQYLQ
jgi:hypothetical protein